jgi:hypothetical protein
MKSHYYFMGQWGLKDIRSIILSSHGRMLTLTYDGSPEGESAAITNAINKSEEESYQQLYDRLKSSGFNREDCTWQYMSIAPLSITGGLIENLESCYVRLRKIQMDGPATAANLKVLEHLDEAIVALKAQEDELTIAPTQAKI